MKISKYRLRLEHDNGVEIIATTSTSSDAARRALIAWEKCPKWAITHVWDMGPLLQEESESGGVFTGHDAFDRAANDPHHGYVGRGNVWSNVQISAYIRARRQTSCNGMSFEEGELQESDLAGFRRVIGRDVTGLVREKTAREGGILYVFFHRYTKRSRRIIHGCFLTSESHHLIWSAPCESRKSGAIIRAMQRRILAQPGEGERGDEA